MKKIDLIQLLVLIFSLELCVCPSVYAKGNDYYYQMVSLPKVSLKTGHGERIDSVKVVMHCGRFVALNFIPNDWSADVAGPVSEETTLFMSAGHGSTSLWSTESLAQFITILVCEPTCFDITVFVSASYFDGQNIQEREIIFSQKELIIKRVSNKAVRRIVGM